MQFPPRPTCHDREWQAQRFGQSSWQPFGDVEPHKSSTRRCSYCGSLHPEDLLNGLRNDATLHGADWKYGWPHKFYVDGIPNDYAGQQVQVGTHSVSSRFDGGFTETPIMGTGAQDIPAKFYAEHLLDEGLDDEARDALIAAIEREAGIRFTVENGDLRYSAPYRGYQR